MLNVLLLMLHVLPPLSEMLLKCVPLLLELRIYVCLAAELLLPMLH